MKFRLALMFEMRPPIADATDVLAFQTQLRFAGKCPGATVAFVVS